MTFAEIKALVKDRLFEHDDVPSGGLLADIDNIVNDALTMLYNDIAEKAPALLQEDSADIAYDPATGLTLNATNLGKDFHLLCGVEIKTSQGVYEPLFPMARREVGAVGGAAIAVSGVAPSTGYWVQNFKIFLDPRPESAQTIRVQFVPTVTELEDDDDVPFGGLFGNFHRLVGYEAIVLATDKDATPQTLWRTYGRMKKQLDAYVASLQRQRPRRIERTDDDYEWDD